MKNTITRAELEAIGENWYRRRNKLLRVAHDITEIEAHREKAFRLAWKMNLRIVKLMLLLGQPKAPTGFQSGGIVSPGYSVKSEGGEFVITNSKPVIL